MDFWDEGLHIHEDSAGEYLRTAIPQGYALSIATGSNSTMSGIKGAGRSLDVFLSTVGRRLERALDRFAEQKLKLGPSMAVLRLIAELHELHTRDDQMRGDGTLEGKRRLSLCRSENLRLDNHDISCFLIAERLMWVCNGFCSQCRRPYVPKLLGKSVPGGVRRWVLQLNGYLREAELSSNLVLATIYTRILIESELFIPLLVQQLEILKTISNTADRLIVRYWNCDPLPPVIVELRNACALLEEQSSREKIGALNVNRFESSLIFALTEKLGTYCSSEGALLPGDDFVPQARKITIAKLLCHIYTLPTPHTWSLIMARDQTQKLLRATGCLHEFSNLHPTINGGISKANKHVEYHISSTAILLNGHSGSVRSVACSPDGAQIVSGSDDKTLRTWDASTGLAVSTFPQDALIASVAFSPDSSHVACGLENGVVRLLDAKLGTHNSTLRGLPDRVVSIAFSPDGLWVAFASLNRHGIIKIWDVQTGVCLRTLEGHTTRVRSLAFAPDGSTIVSGSEDRTIRLWDTATGKQLDLLTHHDGWVMSVVFSPDGTTIASGAADRSVRLWSTNTRRQTAILNGHREWVRSVAFSHSGAYLASASNEGMIRLWNVKTGETSAVLYGHTTWVWSVVFSPSDMHVVSGSRDGTVRIWDVSILTIIPYEDGDIDEL